MDRRAAADAGIVLNHLSNMKLKSGVAPVCDLHDSGVRLGLGCDNCSGSDVQSVFQAMKLFCLIGRDLILAVALASDLTCRVSRAIVGATAAAKIFGASIDQYVQAFGLALDRIGF